MKTCSKHQPASYGNLVHGHAVLLTQDQLAGGGTMPTQLQASSAEVAEPAETPAPGCGSLLVAAEPAVVTEREEPALGPAQQWDGEHVKEAQLHPMDPPANSASWLFLPERRLEADPVRVRPVDLRAARDAYKRTLQLGDPSGAAAGETEGAMSSSPWVPAIASRAQPREDGHEHGQHLMQPSGRGRLRRAMEAMSCTLRGQHRHTLSG